MQNTNNHNEQKELRVIKTARNEKAINKAVEQGYWPLVKPVIPSPDIKVKFAVKQDKTTGKIKVVHDYRLADIPIIKPLKPRSSEVEKIDPDPEVAIGWTYYYPYQFENPYAAYLVPSDLKVGESVFLEDLIEDIESGKWNQGDTYRLQSCEAMWDGKEFVLSLPKFEQVILG